MCGCESGCLPPTGQYSPVLEHKKSSGREGGAVNGHAYVSQLSSPCLLAVPAPHSHHGHGMRSISSSPTSSPPTSTSLSPSSPRSPRSPRDPYPSTAYPYSKIHLPNVVLTDDSENESFDGDLLEERELLARSPSPTPYSSKDSISDKHRMVSCSPKGLRPPPQVVPAHSLPDLLMGRKSAESSDDSPLGSPG